MLNPSEYRRRMRKKITLPSGGEVEIRKLSGMDFLSMGDLPSAFIEGDADQVDEYIERDPEEEKRLAALLVMRGVTSIKLTDKPPVDCADDELSIYEIDKDDYEFLITEIADFTSMSREAGEAIQPFPKESGSVSSPSCNGENVRETSHGDS